jgi:hypothetical protein
VGYIGQQTLVGEEAASLVRFVFTCGGEVDIPPTRETVLEVPEALAVTDQYKCRHALNPIPPAPEPEPASPLARFLDR